MRENNKSDSKEKDLGSETQRPKGGSESPRQAYRTLKSGLTLYRVKLRGGPGDGQESLCSHNTVWHGGEKYVRGADDYYYHEPKAGGKN